MRVYVVLLLTFCSMTVAMQEDPYREVPLSPELIGKICDSTPEDLSFRYWHWQLDSLHRNLQQVTESKCMCDSMEYCSKDHIATKTVKALENIRGAINCILD